MAQGIEKRRTSLEGLLHDIYDDWSVPAHCSLDTDTWTDTSASNFSDHFTSCTTRRQSASARRSIFARRSGVGSAPLITGTSVDDDDVGVVTKFDKLTLWTMGKLGVSVL